MVSSTTEKESASDSTTAVADAGAGSAQKQQPARSDRAVQTPPPKLKATPLSEALTAAPTPEGRGAVPASEPCRSAAASDSAGSCSTGKAASVARRLALDNGHPSSSNTANGRVSETALPVGAAPASSTGEVSSARKERKRIVPTALPARTSDAAALAVATEQPAPAAAGTADDGGSSKKQQHARTAAQGTFRTHSAPAPGLLSEAERMIRLEQERVADVSAELERLCITYIPCASHFAGIRIDLKAKTLGCLRAIKAPIPTITEAEDFEGCLYPPGLGRLLRGAAPPAQLSKQPLLGRPSLLVRATRPLKKGAACGWLSGRLTEAPTDSDTAFTRHQLLIAKDVVKELAGEYKGPALMLDMTKHSNEFRFVADTALRPGEGNVAHSIHLLRDVKQGLVVPVLAITAIRDISKGEELVLGSAREDWQAAEQARQEAQEALSQLQQEKGKQAKGRTSGRSVAAKAADRAEQAEAEAAGAAEQLQASMMEQLLPSGWRQHTLDVFFQRHAESAAKLLADGELAASVAEQLEKACTSALSRYYGSGGSTSVDTGGSRSSSSTAEWQALQAALEASLLKHPPAVGMEELEGQMALEPAERFKRFDSFERPLQESTNFDLLKKETRKLLERLDGEPQELPKGCPDRLGSGGAFPALQVCEVLARLHRVRLLTPPNCRALSLHAPAEGKQLRPGECAAIYVGTVFEADCAPNVESGYQFDIRADEISAAAGAAYAGPCLVVDASEHRNQAAFANCVFGSGRNSNLRPKAVWDPVEKRPHMALLYTGGEACQPGEELLLDYGFESYWAVQAAHAWRAHEEFAELAGEVVLSLRAALREGGAPEKELGSCLLPVDLASHHQQYLRVGE